MPNPTSPDRDRALFSLLNPLPPPPDSTPAAAHAHYASHFRRAAHSLLHHHHLHLLDRTFSFLEVEFYLRDPSNHHADPFTHGHPNQLRTGTWYFHRVGMSTGFKGGTRKGLDITTGCAERGATGGILIRAIREVGGGGQVVEGPSLVCDRILSEFGVQGLKELVEERWGGNVEIWNRDIGLWVERVNGKDDGDANEMETVEAVKIETVETPEDGDVSAKVTVSTSTLKRARADDTSTLTANDDPPSTFKRSKTTVTPSVASAPLPPLYTSPRVGLSLSNNTPTPSLRLQYVHKPYRYMQHPHLLKKGRQLLALGMLESGEEPRRVVTVTGASPGAVETWKKELQEGRRKGKELLKECIGKKVAAEAKLAAKIFGAVKWWEEEEAKGIVVDF
ncbi:hypothetical protein BC937DRAFT_87226 [Endogone sp. FLAS-F59071]|nr:hypothetical protein BC937DRAFT_87226 [Endogone sp. FLAS-F59071]|eukprot:RUS12703.1 hypothetical protein BC937DRAFT_87226 [Endogone sp. FLAS-F59071]